MHIPLHRNTMGSVSTSPTDPIFKVQTTERSVWCVNLSTVVLKAWIGLIWARSSEEELALAFFYRWPVSYCCWTGSVELSYASLQLVLSIVCIATPPPPPAISVDWCVHLPYSGRVSYLPSTLAYHCIYWLRSWWCRTSRVSLPTAYPSFPKYQQNSFEKEEAAKAHAKIILYFILLWK